MNLSTQELSLAYGRQTVIERLDVDFPDRGFTAIVGPNGCGKSTLLRGIARLMPASHGRVLLEGRDLASHSVSEIAKVIGLLPQAQTLPEGLGVADMVARGRFPHQGFLRRWSDEDDRAVERALRTTGITHLARRRVDTLSGGQRQRVWLATVLAQAPSTILLDEPTTYLDLGHQLDVLDLLASLPEQGHTVIAVLHDLNLAARYATHLVAMAEGRVMASGTPDEVVTEELIGEIFGFQCRVMPDPEVGSPMVVPRRRPAVAPSEVGA